MERASDECVGGPPGANFLDNFGGVTGPGSKALTSVDNISGSNSGGWEKIVGPPPLLDKFGWGLCRFSIFGSGSTSVEDVDASIEVPGRNMPCGYVGSK